eukprot:4614799-Amphidinium_carterae.1
MSRGFCTQLLRANFADAKSWLSFSLKASHEERANLQLTLTRPMIESKATYLRPQLPRTSGYLSWGLLLPLANRFH